MIVDCLNSFGLILNIIGVFGLAFFVTEVCIIGGGSEPVNKKDNFKKKFFFSLIGVGFLFQLIGIWI